MLNNALSVVLGLLLWSLLPVVFLGIVLLLFWLVYWIYVAWQWVRSIFVTNKKENA